MSPTSHVYGNLLNAFRRAHASNDIALADRIDAAIKLLQELWPDDCAAWDKMFS